MERVICLLANIIEENEDDREKKVRALLEAQPPLNTSKPNHWEDFKTPQLTEKMKDSTKGEEVEGITGAP